MLQILLSLANHAEASITTTIESRPTKHDPSHDASSAFTCSRQDAHHPRSDTGGRSTHLTHLSESIIQRLWRRRSSRSRCTSRSMCSAGVMPPPNVGRIGNEAASSCTEQSILDTVVWVPDL
jgi:hypothetical protein